jgi:hypothetical protein
VTSPTATPPSAFSVANQSGTATKSVSIHTPFVTRLSPSHLSG